MKKKIYRQPAAEIVAIEELDFLAQSPQANELPNLTFGTGVEW